MGARGVGGTCHQTFRRVLAGRGNLAFRRRMLNYIASLLALAIRIGLRRRPMTTPRLLPGLWWLRLRELRPILRHRDPCTGAYK